MNLKRRMGQRGNFNNLEILLEHYCVDDLLRWWSVWAKQDIPNLGYKSVRLDTKHGEHIGINEHECLFIDKIVTELMAVNQDCLILKAFYYERLKINDMVKRGDYKKSTLYNRLNDARTHFWNLLVLRYAVEMDKEQDWINSHLRTTCM